MMSPSDFRAKAQAIYDGNPYWQGALSRDLGVNPRTVRRWASGETTPPPGVLAWLDRARAMVAIPHEWLVAVPLHQGPETGVDRYVIHTRPPFEIRTYDGDVLY